MRVPRTIRFPFGYTVTVRLVDGRTLPAELDGQWDSERREILVRRTLDATRRRYILGHEVQHAVLDWQHHCCNEGTMKP